MNRTRFPVRLSIKYHWILQSNFYMETRYSAIIWLGKRCFLLLVLTLYFTCLFLIFTYNIVTNNALCENNFPCTFESHLLYEKLIINYCWFVLEVWEWFGSFCLFSKFPFGVYSLLRPFFLFDMVLFPIWCSFLIICMSLLVCATINAWKIWVFMGGKWWLSGIVHLVELPS